MILEQLAQEIIRAALATVGATYSIPTKPPSTIEAV